MRTACLLVLAAAAALAQDPPAEGREERLRRAVEWIQDPDPEIRAHARKELLDLGPDVVPKLEEILKAKGVQEVVQVLREFDLAKGAVRAAPVEPPSEAELLKLAPKPDAAATDKYVYAKLIEAHRQAKAAQYQKAYDMAQALLVLEPRTRYADQVQQLRKFADNMITQTSLVRTRVAGPAGAVAAGAKLELKLRMDNSWKGGIEVSVDKGTTERPSRAIVIVEILCERWEANGTVTRTNRNAEVAIPHDIPIAMGAQWEQSFEVETAGDFPEDLDSIRVYTIGAFLPLAKIDWSLAVSQKRLWFEPSVVKVVPGKHVHLAEDPPAKLAKAIEAGTINEVFICAMLLEGPGRADGLLKLVDLMDRFLEKHRAATDPTEKGEAMKGLAYAANILSAVTGLKHGSDPRRWREAVRQLKDAAPKNP